MLGCFSSCVPPTFKKSHENWRDDEAVKKMETEVQMREGAKTLQAACSRKERTLEVSKSLLASNTPNTLRRNSAGQEILTRSQNQSV